MKKIIINRRLYFFQLNFSLKMKLSSILLIVTVLNVQANSYAQNTKATIKLEDVSVKEVLNEIESLTEFKFLFNRNNIDVDRIVSVNTKQQPVKTILKNLFFDSSVTFELLNKQIVLKSTKEIKTENFDTNIESSILKEVKGTIIDENETPLMGVSIIIKGTNRGVTTDFDGNFSIKIKDGEILVFSYLGYKTTELIYKGQNNVKLVLIENTTIMDELIVVGFGSQKVKDITGSVSQISTDAIEERPILQVTDAMAGKAAGVMVVAPSGKPQGGGFIRIRGTTSIDASSEPLYVVDGIPVEVIYDINPNDIESISILKDASSAAIYGASGANGVVIINTKRGKINGGQISLDSYYGTSTVSEELGTLNSSEYIDLMDELGLVADWSQYTAKTDWQNEIYRTSLRKNYQLSFSGADNGMNYYVSGNYQDTEGVIRSNEVQRYSAKVNFSKQIRNWLKIGTNLTYSKWRDVDVTDNAGAGRGGVVLGALVTPSVIGILNEDETFTGNPLQPSWENPVAGTDAPDKEYLNSRFLGTVYLEADLIDDFQFKTRFSIDDSNGKFTYFLNPYSTDWGRVNQGIASESSNKTFYWSFENMLTYKKTFKAHKIDFLGGFIAQKRNNNDFSAETRSFANEGVSTIAGGSIINYASSYESEKSNQSFIGRVNYAYNDKYLLTANFRADGSSVFGPNYQWGYFPSFSLGWRLTEEKFMKEGFFDDIKFRFGWGQVGNDRIAPYAWYGRVTPGYNYVIGGSIVPGIAPETLENKDLRWETTIQTDFGIDLVLFDNKLNVILDYYVKNTNDLLLSMPIPSSSGFLSSIQNVGEIKNKGFEFAILGNLFDYENFSWNTNFNMSFNDNEIINLKDQIIMTGDIFQRGNVVRAEEGQPMGNFWGFISEGVDPSTGDIIYKDLDGDGIINADGDKTVIGNANPDFTYGFTNTLTYKGFGLNIFFQGVSGNDIFNATRIETEAMTDFKSQSSTVLNRWQQPGDITDIPRAVLGDKYNSDLSTRFIEDGSYLRLKTLSFSYNFNQALIEKSFLSSLKIYFTAENLATFTNYSGYDPEVNAFGSSNLVQGVDYGTYPQTKNFIFGINVSF